MSLEYGLILAFAIVAFGGVALAGFVLWLRNRDRTANAAIDKALAFVETSNKRIAKMERNTGNGAPKKRVTPKRHP